MVDSESIWTKWRGLVAYFALAFAITWLLVSPLALAGLGIIKKDLPRNLHILGSFGPISAAFIVTAKTEGRAGIEKLLAGMRKWHVGLTSLLLAIFSPLLLFIVGAVGLRLSGQSWPDLSMFWREAEFANFTWLAGSLLSAVAYGIGEETGWRGFALPRLQVGRSALFATFVLTLFQALWHFPMFFYRFEFSPLLVVGFFIGMFAGAIWFTCLYNSSRGSILMPILWHTAWNIVNQAATVLSEQMLSTMSAIVMIAALGIVLIWKPINLSPMRKYTISH